MYHTLFPQLIAGPIVRYQEVKDQISFRPITIEDVQWGIVLFCVGLAKKIIIADNVGVIADRMFSLPSDQLSFGSSWLGIAAYTLQIFFDFSGYSDMAIGMGRMLGFRFPENFDQPYRSQSVTEFWRRWHMTLSRWFRDYVYIPLGGNRAGPLRTYLNLTIVFLLCGLWHGAAFTFVIWGLWHGLLLVTERIAHNWFGWRQSGLTGWATTLILVMIGWVFFRSSSLESAWTYLGAMAGLGATSSGPSTYLAVTPDKVTFLILGAVIALAPYNFGWLRTDRPVGLSIQVSSSLAALALFGYSASLIAANGFNPFIYFRF
jgi:alginate O-acetyltransferase complex protein AlgI